MKKVTLTVMAGALLAASTVSMSDTFISHTWTEFVPHDPIDDQCEVHEVSLNAEVKSQWTTFPVSGAITFTCITEPNLPQIKTLYKIGIVGSGWGDSVEEIITYQPAAKLTKKQRKKCKKKKHSKKGYCNPKPVQVSKNKYNYVIDVMHGESVWRIWLNADGTTEVGGANEGVLLR